MQSNHLTKIVNSHHVDIVALEMDQSVQKCHPRARILDDQWALYNCPRCGSKIRDPRQESLESIDAGLGRGEPRSRWLGKCG